MSQRPPNTAIADLLERIGQLLETKETNPYRVRAYFSAAATVRGTDKRVAGLAGDREALMRLPGIGESLAGLIAEYVETGQSALLLSLIHISSAAAARMAGRNRGNVTSTNARPGDAPSICAAWVSDGGRFCQ